MTPTIELMKRHRSVRTFDEKHVGDDTVEKIIEAAGWAATSNYIQAYSVIRVKNKDTRKKIAELAGGQPWVISSPVFLVFCADLNRAKTACRLENTKMAHGFTEQFIIATVDVSLMAQNAMLAAESSGLGGVYIGGIRNAPQTVCDLLKLPDQVYPVFGMCLGYPAEKKEQKPRLPVDVILKQEVYREDENALTTYNEICSRYYQSRSTDARDDTWTAQISRMVSVASRPHMKDFLYNRGFKFK